LADFSFVERIYDGPTSVRSFEKDIIFTRTVRKRLMMLSESLTIYYCRNKMPGEERYDDEHRIFLQGLMCKGILNFKVAQVIISCHIDGAMLSSLCLSCPATVIPVVSNSPIVLLCGT
jgi:hypothetical protein